MHQRSWFNLHKATLFRTRHRCTAEAWCALLATEPKYDSNPRLGELEKTKHTCNLWPAFSKGGKRLVSWNSSGYIFVCGELMFLPYSFQVCIYFLFFNYSLIMSFFVSHFKFSVRFSLQQSPCLVQKIQYWKRQINLPWYQRNLLFVSHIQIMGFNLFSNVLLGLVHKI